MHRRLASEIMDLMPAREARRDHRGAGRAIPDCREQTSLADLSRDIEVIATVAE